jgi:uncharacterized protein with GYD domain
MARCVLLLKFTDKGIAAVKDSPKRADAFREAAAKAGVKVEALLWLHGEYDGLVILSAPEEAALSGLALQLGSRGFVRTTVCRALDEAEFKAALGKL